MIDVDAFLSADPHEDANDTSSSKPILNYNHNSTNEATLDQQPDLSISMSMEEGYYEGARLLSLPSDSSHLTPIQCLTRSNLQLFSANQNDVVSSKNGRRAPITYGKVGIRCVHCTTHLLEGGSTTNTAATTTKKGLQDKRRKNGIAGSVSYPANIDALYTVCSQKPNLHFLKCVHTPIKIKQEFITLVKNQVDGRTLDNNSRGRGVQTSVAKMYFVIAAKRIGLVDKANAGIRFGRDPKLEPLVMEDESIKKEVLRLGGLLDDKGVLSVFNAFMGAAVSPIPVTISSTNTTSTTNNTNHELPVLPINTIHWRTNPPSTEQILQNTKATPLISPHHRHYITDFVYLTISQLAICHASQVDIVNKHSRVTKMHHGFAGLCCKHCKGFGDVGGGRFFYSAPDNIASGTGTTFYQHVLKCGLAPEEVRRVLPSLKKSHGRQRGGLGHGSQRRFFNSVWNTLRRNDLISDAAVADADLPDDVPSADTITISPPVKPDGHTTDKVPSTDITTSPVKPDGHTPDKVPSINKTPLKPSQLFTERDTLAEHHFIASSSNPDMYQCRKCRMVPYDLRAPHSLILLPSSDILIKAKFHATKCKQKDFDVTTVLDTMKRMINTCEHIIVETFIYPSFIKFIQCLCDGDESLTNFFTKHVHMDYVSSEQNENRKIDHAIHGTCDLTHKFPSRVDEQAIHNALLSFVLSCTDHDDDAAKEKHKLDNHKKLFETIVKNQYFINYTNLVCQGVNYELPTIQSLMDAAVACDDDDENPTSIRKKKCEKGNNNKSNSNNDDFVVTDGDKSYRTEGHEKEPVLLLNNDNVYCDKDTLKVDKVTNDDDNKSSPPNQNTPQGHSNNTIDIESTIEIVAAAADKTSNNEQQQIGNFLYPSQHHQDTPPQDHPNSAIDKQPNIQITAAADKTSNNEQQIDHFLYPSQNQKDTPQNNLNHAKDIKSNIEITAANKTSSNKPQIDNFLYPSQNQQDTRINNSNNNVYDLTLSDTDDDDDDDSLQQKETTNDIMNNKESDGLLPSLSEMEGEDMHFLQLSDDDDESL